jgi:hypothetical protein
LFHDLAAKLCLCTNPSKKQEGAFAYGFRLAFLGDTPYGPFNGGNDNPVLSTTPDSTTYGPGHHTVFREGQQDYILYHRLTPNKEKAVLRQLCIDSLNYIPDGSIKKIIPKGVRPFIKANVARK